MSVTAPEETNPDAAAPWASLEADLLRRVRRTSVWLGLVMSAPFTFYFGAGAGAAWVLGTVWSLVNLHMIASIVRGVLTLEPRPWTRLVPALVVKFPLLYAGGFLLLRSRHLSTAWLVAGFAWPFFVVVMKAFGRVVLDLDASKAQARPR